MKRLAFHFLVLGFMVFPAFAQDGTSAARQEFQTGAVATSSAPRAETLSPSVAVPTPTATAPLENAPESASPMTSPPETMPVPPEENSNTSLYIISALASAVLVGLGAYQLRSRKVKQDGEDEKKDGKRCLNFKKMMEDKLKELTDLRGQIESKTKEKVREKVRVFLTGTSAGEVLKKIEAAEKEYARIRQLYEKCVIEFGGSEIKLYFTTHATTVDNESKIASGWKNAELSELGKKQAKELGETFKSIKLDLICTSDLKRAVDTVKIAFGDKIPVIADKRLREINYGDFNGKPSEIVEPLKTQHIKTPFPNGESYTQAMSRVQEFFKWLKEKHSGKTILVVGHRATQYSLDIIVGKKLEELLGTPFKWKTYWEYKL